MHFLTIKGRPEKTKKLDRLKLEKFEKDLRAKKVMEIHSLNLTKQDKWLKMREKSKKEEKF